MVGVVVNLGVCCNLQSWNYFHMGRFELFAADLIVQRGKGTTEGELYLATWQGNLFPDQILDQDHHTTLKHRVTTMR